MIRFVLGIIILSFLGFLLCSIILMFLLNKTKIEPGTFLPSLLLALIGSTLFYSGRKALNKRKAISEDFAKIHEEKADKTEFETIEQIEVEEKETRYSAAIVMYYAGFWVRLGAGLIDGLFLFIPLLFVRLLLQQVSWELYVVCCLATYFVYPVYNIYFHGKSGQTIGKMAVRIKVVQPDSSPISYKHAFLRHMVDLILTVPKSVAFLIALLSISEATFKTSGWGIIDQKLPVWGIWADYSYTFWVISELIVLLFNKKKRAIHDFIAGTVVINLRKKKIPSDISLDEKLNDVLSKIKK